MRVKMERVAPRSRSGCSLGPLDIGRMKITTISVCAVAGVLMALITLERWDEPKNHGLSWGYWGEFNTVSKALAQVPGVTISQSWCNADFLALEEFGFDI